MHRHAIRQGLALKDGKGEAVGGVVMMLKGENSREVVKRVKAKVDEINASTVLPDGIKLMPFYDRSEIVGKSINTVIKDPGRRRDSGCHCALSAPAQFQRCVDRAFGTAAFDAAYIYRDEVQAGLNANLMSLGGLAISIGMIIDATIIQVENVQRHLGHLKDKSHKLGTVFKAVVEVQKAQYFRRIHHRLDIHSDNYAAGHGRQNVCAAGIYGGDRAFCLDVPFDFCDSGSVLLLPQTRRGERKPAYEMGHASYICPMLSWALSKASASL